MRTWAEGGMAHCVWPTVYAMRMGGVKYFVLLVWFFNFIFNIYFIIYIYIYRYCCCCVCTIWTSPSWNKINRIWFVKHHIKKGPFLVRKN